MKQWLDTLGAGAKVMVLDSGLYEHNHVKPVGVRNFTHHPINYLATHGNDMAEIIAGRDPLCMGMAPYCDLYVAKVYCHGGATHWPSYEQALEWAIAENVDVVNMSFGASSLSEGFAAHLKTLDERGTICLAAYSAFSGFQQNPSVLTVGRLGPRSQAQALVVGELSRRAANGHWRKLQGTSVSTAILSGVAACAKAALPDLNRLRFMTALAALQHT